MIINISLGMDDNGINDRKRQKTTGNDRKSREKSEKT